MTRKYHKFTQEEIDFISCNALNLSNIELTDKFNKRFNVNVPIHSIKTIKKKHQIKTNLKHIFSYEEKQFIYDNYKKYYVPQLADEFNKKFGTNITRVQISTFKQTHNLKLGHPYKPYGKKHGYGHKKTDEVKQRIGQAVRNRARKVGHESMCNGHIYIKVNDKPYGKDNYISKARYIYEKHYGKVPSNYAIFHLDGNKLNDNINNLVAITKSQLMYLKTHGLCFKNKKLNETAIMSTDLLFKANKRKKEVI